MIHVKVDIFALYLATAKIKTHKYVLYMEQKSKIVNKKTGKFAFLNWLTAKIYTRGNYHFYSMRFFLSKDDIKWWVDQMDHLPPAIEGVLEVFPVSVFLDIALCLLPPSELMDGN